MWSNPLLQAHIVHSSPGKPWMPKTSLSKAHLAQILPTIVCRPNRHQTTSIITLLWVYKSYKGKKKTDTQTQTITLWLLRGAICYDGININNFYYTFPITDFKPFPRISHLKEKEGEGKKKQPSNSTSHLRKCFCSFVHKALHTETWQIWKMTTVLLGISLYIHPINWDYILYFNNLQPVITLNLKSETSCSEDPLQ